MNTTSTTITNQSDGAITTVTVIHHDFFNYHSLIIAIVAAVLIAWALRKIFWTKDSD